MKGGNVDDCNHLGFRKSSITIHSDMVHEGTHALDYLRGISYSERAGWAGEIRAYNASEDDIQVHVWKNYKTRDEK